MVDENPTTDGSPSSEVQGVEATVAAELVAEGRATVAPEGSSSPVIGDGPAATKTKSIFLFADGTGNSSAKLFKTNVWRMYEALDLGRAPQGERAQVAYYDNGVGTSNFRPLRLLGGIFGIGLKSNVLRLYSFLCQNYRKGDKIYAFGFSRGAFTIRLLVGLIVSQGIILRQNGEAPPKYQIKDAYRSLCMELQPNRWPAWLARWARRLRDGLIDQMRISLRRKPFNEVERHFTDVEFVGVWDTVAAYGGPFAEVTRGIDDWVWPLTLPEYGLSARVVRARHALSLDDERDAFSPLLWDEYRERQLATDGEEIVVGIKDGEPVRENRTVVPGRLSQVWFSGVHSDVGGGYPDESLSYISLLWMMDELGDDVRFIKQFTDRARALANPYGPIHDSRAGLASYYRYQPRKIAAMTDPARQRYFSLRDPEIGRIRDKKLKDSSPYRQWRWRKHGLLRKVAVHESAIARIMSGIDGYAPAALPANFDIVPVKIDAKYSKPALSEDDYKLLETARSREPKRIERQERAWNKVWARRGIYFATVAVSLALLLLPWVNWFSGVEELCQDDRCFARTFLEKPAFLLPSAVEKFWALYLAAPFTLLVGLLVLLLLMAGGRLLEHNFRSKIYAIWRDTIYGPQTPTAGVALAMLPTDGWFDRAQAKLPPFWRDLLKKLTSESSSLVQRVRESRIYQSALFDLKWRFLPGIFGIAILACLLVAGSIVSVQISYALGESAELFCENRTTEAGWRETPAPVHFATDSSCTDLGVNVVGGRRYAIRLHEVENWADGANTDNFPWRYAARVWTPRSYAANPIDGVKGPDGVLAMAWPYARVTSANFMEPLTEVRTRDLRGFWGTVREWMLGPDIDIQTTEFKASGSNSYEMAFCPERSGHLYLMVNDAGFTYGNNSGSALVEVLDVGALTEGEKCPPEQPSS